MPVFNTAANTVLQTPVTDQYKSKALRLGNEALQQKIEMAPAEQALAERRVAVDEKNAAIREEELNQAIEEWRAAAGEKSMKEQAGALIALGEEARSSDDPVAYANERLPEIIGGLPEGPTRDYLIDRAQGGFTQEELVGIETIARAAVGKYPTETEDSQTEFERILQSLEIPDKQKEQLRLARAEHLAGQGDEKKPDVKPLKTPTRAESEVVDEVLAQIERENEKADYDVKESEYREAAGWIGEQAKALMELESEFGNAIGFDSAVRKAAEMSKQFFTIDKEVGVFFDGDKSFNPPELGIGARVSRNGVNYVVVGWDNSNPQYPNDPILLKVD